MPTSTPEHPPLAPPSAPRGSSTGALWTAGLGAFLLFAAAATFVAVRWDSIPDEAKLAALVAVTGVCIAAHQGLRRSFPVTATALFHLGVLLVPIDVAAFGVSAGWVWPQMLFAQGLAATVVFGVASQVERSVVFRYATWAGVVVLAGGIGGLTTAPAGLTLAGIAFVAAVVVSPQRPELRLDLGAGAWAALAGFATPLAAARTVGLLFDGTLARLGLASPAPHPMAAATGLVAGLALGVLGARHGSVAVVLTGVAAAFVGVVTTWVALEPSTDASLVAVATLGLAVQVARQTLQRDPFWGRAATVLAEIGTPVTGLLTVGFGGVLVLMPFGDLIDAAPVSGLAAGLVAVTWLITQPRLPWAAALSAAASVALFTGRQDATAAALALAGAAVLAAPKLSQRDDDKLWAVLFVGAAPVVAADTWPFAAATAVVGAVAIAVAAVRASRAGSVVLAFELATLSLVPLAAGAFVVGSGDRWFGTALGVIGVCWLTGLVLERATQAPGQTPLAAIPRIAMLTVLLGTPGLRPLESAAVGGLVFLLSVADGVRLDEPIALVAAGCAAPVVLVGLALDAGWTVGQASMLVTATSLVWLGLAGSLPGRWAPPALISALLAGGAGLALGSDDPVALSTNLIVLGAAAAAVGVLVDQLDLAMVGAGLMCFGIWGRLGTADVTASEAYVAPVALFLLLAGLEGRRRLGTGSWLTVAPAVALLGGTALFERLDGGPSWHAAIAGVVGVMAVAIGGTWRLAGPLLVGTVLVVATTIHETLGVTAGVPTEAWLATGGVLLLASAFAMERRGVGPIESGRRLVDVIGDRFT
jgi:hypothetical protein